MTTWILVANQSVAKIFERSSKNGVPELIEEFQHPAGRLHEGDLVTDKGAAVFQSAGSGQQRSTGTEVEATEHQAQIFAGELAEQLRRARVDDRYRALALICAPAFLGHLREALDDATAKLVTAEVDKNISEQPTGELPATLQNLL